MRMFCKMLHSCPCGCLEIHLAYAEQLSTLNHGLLASPGLGVGPTHVASLPKRYSLHSPIGAAWGGELQEMEKEPTMAAAAANSLSRQAPWGHQSGLNTYCGSLGTATPCLQKRLVGSSASPAETFTPTQNMSHCIA